MRWVTGAIQYVDRSDLFAQLTNLMTLVTGPIVAWSVATRLTPETQGYYYSFGSILAFLSLFEAGLSQIIIMLVAQIPRDEADAIPAVGEVGEGVAEQLSQITRFALGRFVVWGGSGVLALGGIGAFIFSHSHAQQAWAVPWGFFCLLSAVNFFLVPVFAVLQGLGHVASYWFYRSVQQCVYGIALILGLQTGLQLNAPAFAALCILVWAISFLALKHRQTMRVLFRGPRGRLQWTKELGGLQARIASTQLASFLGPQALVPLCFVTVGAVPAGQLGLTWSLASFVQALGQNVVLTRFPALSRRAGQDGRDRLRGSAWRLAGVALAITLMASIGVGVGLVVLGRWQPSLASRVLPTWGILAFFAVAGVAVCMLGVSAWYRARRRDPLAWFAVIGTLAGLVCAVAGAAVDEVRGLVVGFASGNILVSSVGLLVVHRRQSLPPRSS